MERVKDVLSRNILQDSQQAVQPTSFQQHDKSTISSESISSLYTVGKMLGKGTFGSVYKAKSKHGPGRAVALKQLRDTKDKSKIENLREVIFFRNVPKHQNLIRIYDMIHDSETSNVFFSLEYMQGNLLQYINHKRTQAHYIRPEIIKRISADMLSGLSHIHKHGFVHRDIKPENILFKRTRSTFQIKLADFGLSCPLVSTTNRKWTDYVATRWYRAPEQLLGVYSHTAAIDVWSVAVVICELCNLRPVFPGKDVVHMLQLQLDALGIPSFFARGGAYNESLSLLTQLLGEGVEDHKCHLNGCHNRTDWFFMESHEIFQPALLAAIRWDPMQRPTALQMLRILEGCNANRDGRPQSY